MVVLASIHKVTHAHLHIDMHTHERMQNRITVNRPIRFSDLYKANERHTYFTWIMQSWGHLGQYDGSAGKGVCL